MQEAKETARDLAIGIVLIMIVVIIIGMFFVQNKIAFLLGELLGSGLALVILSQMYKSLDNALDRDPDSAVKYSRVRTMIRLLVMGLGVAVALLLPKYFNVIAVLLGILGLKFAAYLQPIIHNITNKIIHKGR